MLKVLKNKLHPAKKLLTIAVGATANRGHESYDIKNIVTQVDFINLMTYDLHGSWDQKTGINSPLYSRDQLSVDACVNFWISKGCPREKLIVGMPLYGRSFTLSNPSNHNIGQPATTGRAGNFIPSASGFLPYNEICTDVKHNGWTRVFAQIEKAPYAYKGNQWVGYDDLESIKLKLDYVLVNQLGGAMFWSIETDDFGELS
jgi:chitinase